MKNTLQLLRRMTVAFPPPEGKNHAVCLYGDRLAVYAWFNGEMKSIYLEEEDLGKSVEEILLEIEKLLPLEQSK